MAAPFRLYMFYNDKTAMLSNGTEDGSLHNTSETLQPHTQRTTTPHLYCHANTAGGRDTQLLHAHHAYENQAVQDSKQPWP
jgi:hypothetical protein